MDELKKVISISSFARSLQLPRDCRKGNVLVTMYGHERVCIDNFKSILSYTPDEIRLITRKNRICISGKQLKIDSFLKDEVEISGYIKKLEYE